MTTLAEAQERAIVATVRHIRQLDEIEREAGRPLTRDEEDRIMHALACGIPVRVEAV